MELVDVSKWFGRPLKINPDFVSIVEIVPMRSNKYFTVEFLSRQDIRSVEYEDDKLCEYEMEMFCKRLQGETA